MDILKKKKNKRKKKPVYLKVLEGSLFFFFFFFSWGRCYSWTQSGLVAMSSAGEDYILPLKLRHSSFYIKDARIVVFLMKHFTIKTDIIRYYLQPHSWTQSGLVAMSSAGEDYILPLKLRHSSFYIKDARIVVFLMKHFTIKTDIIRYYLQPHSWTQSGLVAMSSAREDYILPFILRHTFFYIKDARIVVFLMKHFTMKTDIIRYYLQPHSWTQSGLVAMSSAGEDYILPLKLRHSSFYIKDARIVVFLMKHFTIKTDIIRYYLQPHSWTQSGLVAMSSAGEDYILPFILRYSSFYIKDARIVVFLMNYFTMKTDIIRYYLQPHSWTQSGLVAVSSAGEDYILPFILRYSSFYIKYARIVVFLMKHFTNKTDIIRYYLQPYSTALKLITKKENRYS